MTYMEWIQYVFFSIVFIALTRILQKETLKNPAINPLSYSIVYQVINFLIACIYGMISGLKFDQFTNVIPNIVLMVLLHSIANVILFYAYQQEEMSIVTVVFSFSTVFTVLVSVIFFGQEVSITKLFGILTIVVGIFIVSIDQKNKLTLSKGTLYAFCAAILSGSAFANDAFILSGNRDISTYLVIAFFFPSVVLPLIFLKRVKSVIQALHPVDMVRTFLMSFLYFLSLVAAYLALQISNNVTSVSPLLQLSTPLTVIFSILILKENRNIIQKIVGSIMALIGAYVILI